MQIKKKFLALLAVAMLYSASIFAQASCTQTSESWEGDIRIRTWSCSDGRNYMTGAIWDGSQWVIVFDEEI